MKAHGMTCHKKSMWGDFLMAFQIIFLNFFICCVTGFCKRQFSVQKHFLDFCTPSSSQKCSSGSCSVGVVPHSQTCSWKQYGCKWVKNPVIRIPSYFYLLNSAAWGSLKTQKMPFFLFFFPKKVFQAFGSTSLDFTLWNHHRKRYLGKKLRTEVSELL